MPRFAANLSMLFTEHPFAERFSAAARAGFSAVEFHFPYDHAAAEVAAWAREAGVKVALFNLPPGDWAAGERGLAAVPGREAEFRAGVERALAYAQALDTPCLHAMAGIVPPGADKALCRAVYIDNLRHAARRVADEGRTLLIEAINPRDMPGYFLNSPHEAAAICAEVGESNLKSLFDMYHAQIVGGDLSTTLAALLPHIAHVQIAGVPGRHEPDTGEIDYRWLLGRLDALGYTGWVGCEYRPRGATEAGLGWLRQFAGKNG